MEQGKDPRELMYIIQWPLCTRCESFNSAIKYGTHVLSYSDGRGRSGITLEAYKPIINADLAEDLVAEET